MLGSQLVFRKVFLVKILNPQWCRNIFSSFLRSLVWRIFARYSGNIPFRRGENLFLKQSKQPWVRTEKKWKDIWVASDLHGWRHSADLNRYMLFCDLLLSSLRVTGKDMSASFWRKKVSKLGSWLNRPRIRQQWCQLHSSAFLLLYSRAQTKFCPQLCCDSWFLKCIQSSEHKWCFMPSLFLNRLALKFLVLLALLIFNNVTQGKT